VCLIASEQLQAFWACLLGKKIDRNDVRDMLFTREYKPGTPGTASEGDRYYNQYTSSGGMSIPTTAKPIMMMNA
jgi:hypothetical protein